MNAIRDLFERLRKYVLGNGDAEKRRAEVPFADRYADEIQAYKVVRDALLVR